MTVYTSRTKGLQQAQRRPCSERDPEPRACCPHHGEASAYLPEDSRVDYSRAWNLKLGT